MRKLIVCALFLNASLLLARIWQDLPARADGLGGGAGASANGDLNGDGSRNISDASYLLNWLFLGGPEPVALAAGEGLTPVQEEILSHMSIVFPDGQKTIRFSGVNVQVVNGLGATNGNPGSLPQETDPLLTMTNGLGNIIVGYNEADVPRRGCELDRSGSHNIVFGVGASYGSFGGLVGGLGNCTGAPFASVSGGKENGATAPFASVSGGEFNFATAEAAWIGGGSVNRAAAKWSSVAGGGSCGALSEHATVAGGLENIAGDRDRPRETVGATVCGGLLNRALGMAATVSGGGGLQFLDDGDRDQEGNVAAGDYSSVSGGSRNTASGMGASVIGGRGNRADGNWSSVAGGGSDDEDTGNIAVGNFSSVAGGRSNGASGGWAAVSGGAGNAATTTFAVVSGGFGNAASGRSATVSGGCDQSVTSSCGHAP